MTYQQLLQILQEAPPAILEQNATVHLSQTDKYLPLDYISFSGDETDALTEGHLFLDINF
jgi:hypothetical protein